MFIVSVFTKMSSQPSLSGWKTQSSTVIPLAANMAAVCEGRVEHYPPCVCFQF